MKVKHLNVNDILVSTKSGIKVQITAITDTNIVGMVIFIPGTYRGNIRPREVFVSSDFEQSIRDGWMLDLSDTKLWKAMHE